MDWRNIISINEYNNICFQVESSEQEEDLSSILTRISRHVALVRQSNVPSDPNLHQKRQIPLKQDTLIRYVTYFSWL